MNVLITGASGFLGSRVVRTFVNAGHHVAILVRPTSDLGQVADVRSQLDVHRVDQSPESVRDAVDASTPDVVIHTATYYARDHQAADLMPMLEANVAFPLRLVDAMTRAGVRHFIDTGSAWQFYESAGYRPVCLHSATKQAFADLLAFFVDTGTLKCTTLVMHDSYGAGDPRRKIFTILRDHAGKLEPLPMSGGDQLIDLVHVDDAARAYVVAAERMVRGESEQTHETFSLSGGRALPLRQIVDMYVHSAGLDVTIDWGGRPYHGREVMVPWKTEIKLPGWLPRIDLQTGLGELARVTHSYA